MALNITQSSIGVDVSGMIGVVKAIQLNLIGDSRKSINSGIENLRNNIPNYWKGASAGAFSSKCEIERGRVTAILTVLEMKMLKDIGTMAANTGIADTEVATAILSGSGQTLGSSTGGGSTPVPVAPDPQTDPVPQPYYPDQTTPAVEDPTATPEQDDTEANNINVDGTDTTPVTEPTEEENPTPEKGPVIDVDGNGDEKNEKTVPNPDKMPVREDDQLLEQDSITENPEALPDLDGSITEPAPTINSPIVPEYKPNPNYTGQVLTKSLGRVQGPQAEETYYNLNMSGCFGNVYGKADLDASMASLGLTTDDIYTSDSGLKMLGNYIMVAADVLPTTDANGNEVPAQFRKGDIVQTSLGPGIVVDHCAGAHTRTVNGNTVPQFDIAANW